jgi:ferredoxin
VRSLKKKYEIEHDRENCIACGACTVLAPKFWILNKKDGKADLVNRKKRGDGYENLDINEKDFLINKDAADSCPVNAINIINKETKKRIV